MPCRLTPRPPAEMLALAKYVDDEAIVLACIDELEAEQERRVGWLRTIAAAVAALAGCVRAIYQCHRGSAAGVISPAIKWVHQRRPRVSVC